MKVKIKQNIELDADLIKDAKCNCKCHNQGQYLKEMCEKCREKADHKAGVEIECDCRCHLAWCSDCEKNHRTIPSDPNPIIHVVLSYKKEKKEIDIFKNDSEKSISKAFRAEFKIENSKEILITQTNSNAYKAEENGNS